MGAAAAVQSKSPIKEFAGWPERGSSHPQRESRSSIQPLSWLRKPYLTIMWYSCNRGCYWHILTLLFDPLLCESLSHGLLLQTCKRSLILIWKFQDHVADLDLLVSSRSLLMILANWSWSLIFDLQNWRSILYYLKCLTVYWNQIIWCSGGFWCWANNVLKSNFKLNHTNLAKLKFTTF